MADPYIPALADFKFSADELTVLELALASEKPWDYAPGSEAATTLLKSAKDKILNLHLQRHGWTCCYCRTNLQGAGPFMTDREHVLPKGKAAYKKFSYELWNLAAACKRCNMQFKRSGDGFVVDPDDAEALLTSENYRFVHPNFDLWEDHLGRLSVQVNATNIVKILKRDTAKSAYAHDFFDLKAFEIDSFDGGQGMNNIGVESAAVWELRKLAEAFGQ